MPRTATGTLTEDHATSRTTTRARVSICDNNGADYQRRLRLRLRTVHAPEPFNSTYLHRTTLSDGYSATESLLRAQSRIRRVVLLVTDDKYYNSVQWSLTGHESPSTAAARPHPPRFHHLGSR